VTVTVANGTEDSGSDSLTVTVNNVAPTTVLTGLSVAGEGASYTVGLGPISDPGNDAVVRYTVHWGDGVNEDYPVGTEAHHIYADGPAAYTVQVDLIDEDGTHANAAAREVRVANVPPVLLIQGPAQIGAGSVYSLTLSASDPGEDGITRWRITWGDGIVEDILGNPASATHTYANGPATYAISATATDEDGTHDSNTISVRVAAPASDNAAPVLTGIVCQPASVARGADVTLVVLEARDEDGQVVQAAFYRDANGDGRLDPEVDILLGTDSDAGDGWNWTGSTTDWPEGRILLLARVQDDQGLWGESRSTEGEVRTVSPVVALLRLPLSGWQDIPWSAPPTRPLSSGDFRFPVMENRGYVPALSTMIVMMVEVNDSPWLRDDAVAMAPQSSARVIDVLTNDLDIDGDRLTVTITVAPQHGTARVADGQVLYTPDSGYTGPDRFEYTASDGKVDDTATVQVLVTDAPATPIVEQFACSPNVIVSGSKVTLTATGVTDPDGQVVLALFYRDANGNGTLELGIDILLGVDHDGSDGWTWTGATDDWLRGRITFLVRVQDNQGLWSEVKITTAQIRRLNRSSLDPVFCLLLCAGALARRRLVHQHGDSRSRQASTFSGDLPD
jgi:hypothetical protein